MMGDGFFGATAAGLFWTVNVCWAHPVISRASAVASSIFFMVRFWVFEVLQNRMRRKLNNPKQWVEISLLIFINVASGAMNRHCIPGLTMSTALTGELLVECLEQLKWCTQGLARTRIALCQRPGADTEETGRYDLWERFGVVFPNALSKYIELSKV